MTGEEWKALPENARRYIMMLETQCDHSGTVRSEMILRDYVELLESRINEVNGCFDRAVAEGLYERLQEAEPDDQTYASLVDLVQRRLLHAYAPTPDRPAALATQPATSQEGEGYSREWCMNMAALEGNAEISAGSLDHPLRLAATPTPPTLSEDLRALVEALKPLADLYLTGSEPDDECAIDASDFPNAGHVRAARAALAQMKAS